MDGHVPRCRNGAAGSFKHWKVAGLHRRAGGLHTEAILDFPAPTDVVVVRVGDQYFLQPQVVVFQGLENGLGLAGIDQHRRVATAYEVGKVVA